jgi:nuclear transport factor 2 (NTF2) superfamily protein
MRWLRCLRVPVFFSVISVVKHLNFSAALEFSAMVSIRKREETKMTEQNAAAGTAKQEVDVARPPLPPFTRESAIQKVRGAEDGWNTRAPEKVCLAYTMDSRWRNRAEFINGRQEIIAFLTRKWQAELDYRLIKELWAFNGNHIAVRFAYESHDPAGNWFRSYGNENWEFAPNGLMQVRYACINDLAIKESDRKFHWPLGRRPDGHPSLSDLGF